ncbi:hypothetical protein [Janibacter terrae]|uniref:hypothetical protein n=1 Tax=Janibacter terrae TaxID=103817 RepID=UPI00082BBD57|nr:hypothetical protein [Janibacter terrae]
MPSIADRARAAADPDADTDVLRDAATDRAPKVRAAVAQNPSTPSEVLALLVEDERWQVRFGVVDNPSAAARRVALSCTDRETRALAAQRDDLTPEDLERILADPEPEVREFLAQVVTDERVVARLAADEAARVRAALAQNVAVPDDLLEGLARDRRAEVRSAAAISRRLSPETVLALADDRSVTVQWWTLTSHPERRDVAERIAAQGDEMNAEQARDQLEHPRQPPGTGRRVVES